MLYLPSCVIAKTKKYAGSLESRKKKSNLATLRLSLAVLLYRNK